MNWLMNALVYFGVVVVVALALCFLMFMLKVCDGDDREPPSKFDNI